MSSIWNRFWFDFRVSTLHLAVFRVAFFSVFSLQAFMQIDNAARYGMGDFNVGQLAGTGLERLLPFPNRPLMLTLFVTQAYLAAAIAVGRLSRAWVAVLGLLLGLGYFVSLLDSYQHHFMMVLVLCALSFQRWQPEARSRSSVGDWPLRLVLVLVSIVYFWAIITKLEPVFLGGRTLQLQVTDGWMHELFVGLPFGTNDPLAPYAFAAKIVVVIEAVLAVAIHVGPLRLPAALLGMAFHLGLELSGFFSIGLFSYFMVAIYLLVLPLEDVRAFLAKRFPKLASPEPGPLVSPGQGPPRSKRFIAAGLASITLAAALIGLSFFGSGGAVYVPLFFVTVGALLLQRGAEERKSEPEAEASRPAAWQLAVCVLALVVGSGALWLLLPFDESALLAAMLGFVGLGLTLRWWLFHSSVLRMAVTHLAACATILLFSNTTEATRNYYFYWGLGAARMGDTATGSRTLSRLIELAPDHADGHLWLGRMFAEKDPERAIRLFQESQRLDPDNYRAYLDEAELQHQAGHGKEAYEAASQAKARSPADRRAAEIMSYWHDRI